MQSLLDRKLLFVTGKGGVGKTTMAAAIGLLAARAGRRTIVVEVGEQSQLEILYGLSPGQPGVERKLEPRLSSISIDPDRALLEWLQVLGGRVSGRVLASSGTFQYFAAAAPGAKELVSMVKIWQLTRGGERRSSGSYDLVVVDAPATGHALGLLRSPQTFGAIARVGPIAGQTKKVQELLTDPASSAYLAVALGTEMAVTEALEMQEALGRQLERDLEAVIVNALLPRRFNAAELGQIAGLAPNGRVGHGAVADGKATVSPATALAGGDAHAVMDAAARAARAVHERSRLQHNQVARLRRRSFDVIGVPFAWGPRLDLPAVEGISARLGRKLDVQ
ncbi:MAG: ArsA family ATPase [Solirubrobacteraceae bacterium]